jgi:flavodoxin
MNGNRRFIIMKILVVFYSRTGKTRKVAEELRNSLDCDIEELIDTKSRSGPIEYIRAARDAGKHKLTVLEKIKNDPANYDLIIIGTPNWADTMAMAVRTYITENYMKFNNVAFFETAGRNNFDGAFSDMKELIGSNPLAVMGVRSKEVNNGIYKTKVVEFLKKINSS